MAISETICSSRGHKIESLRITDKMIPVPTGVAGQTMMASISQFEVACITCGLPLSEIRENEKKPPKRIRKKKSESVQETTS